MSPDIDERVNVTDGIIGHSGGRKIDDVKLNITTNGSAIFDFELENGEVERVAFERGEAEALAEMISVSYGALDQRMEDGDTE